MKSLLKLAVVLSGAFIYIGHAEASCVAVTPNTSTTTLSNYTIQRDTPIGTTIAVINTPVPPTTTVARCTPSGYIYLAMEYYNKKATSITDVFETNIPGVGIKFSTQGGTNWAIPGPRIYYNNVNVYEAASRVITLVKTGPITSGNLQSGLVGKTYTDTNQTAASYYISGGSVTQLACSIRTSNVNVPLDPVLASSFTGVNTTRGDKKFTIGLDCDAGARINASLSFTQNTDTSNDSVINLTGAGGANVAKGVGIQLLYGSTVLKNNTNVVLKTSTGGQEFPAGAFTARYFQTKSTVTTGDANATATLNLTYR